jgi:hypothetical protein
MNDADVWGTDPEEIFWCTSRIHHPDGEQKIVETCADIKV